MIGYTYSSVYPVGARIQVTHFFILSIPSNTLAHSTTPLAHTLTKMLTAPSSLRSSSCRRTDLSALPEVRLSNLVTTHLPERTPIRVQLLAHPSTLHLPYSSTIRYIFDVHQRKPVPRRPVEIYEIENTFRPRCNSIIAYHPSVRHFPSLGRLDLILSLDQL
jgi:hypothetical protein